MPAIESMIPLCETFDRNLFCMNYVRQRRPTVGAVHCIELTSLELYRDRYIVCSRLAKPITTLSKDLTLLGYGIGELTIEG